MKRAADLRPVIEAVRAEGAATYAAMAAGLNMVPLAETGGFPR